MIFLVDALNAKPDDVDFKALMRVVVPCDVPVTFNEANAQCLMACISTLIPHGDIE